MSENGLIHKQKIQLNTQVIRIKEFVVKVRKKIKGIYSINNDDIYIFHERVVLPFNEDLFLQINL